MPYKKYASEWLELAKHNLEAAEILINAGHYTDVIGLELQQGIEKTLKSIFAYEGIRIEKTHDLVLLLKKVKNYIDIPAESYDICDIATTYYTEQRYPIVKNSLPPLNEIQVVNQFAKDLFSLVWKIVCGE